MAANAFMAVLLLLAVVGVSVTSAVRCYNCEATEMEYNKMQECAYNSWTGNTTDCLGQCYIIFSPGYDGSGSVKHVKRGCTEMDIPQGCGVFEGKRVCHRVCYTNYCNSGTPDFEMASDASSPSRSSLAFFLPVMAVTGLVARSLL